MRYGRVAPWLFVLPTIVGLALFRIGPIVAAFLVSFTRWNVISSPQWQGLANYRELMSSEIFWRVLKNTVVFSVTYVPGVMVCGLFLAILVNTKLKGITFFRGLYYLPVITSTVAIGVVWSWILSPRFGALPRILNNLGVMNVPSFLGDSRYALLTLVVVYIWKMSGYHMILFLAGLQNIPEVYYEAAKIDGATPWQLLRHVTLPLLSTTTFFIMIIALIQSLQTFDLTFAMTEGGPNNASATLSFFTYVNAFVHFRMGYAASMAFVLFLIVGSITLANFWARKYWVSTLD
ncbi:MAG: ABC transporter permease [Peptococcaceae bacterium 1109]|jgi:multiple sugar transport system permease protein|nr:MAG: ABC transporter permease [Peptococcaceae bacterium 1109]